MYTIHIVFCALYLLYFSHKQKTFTQPPSGAERLEIMKKMIIGFLLGVAMTAAVLGAYAHYNMVDMNRVVDIQTSDEGAMIVIDSGDGYYWER